MPAMEKTNSHNAHPANNPAEHDVPTDVSTDCESDASADSSSPSIAVVNSGNRKNKKRRRSTFERSLSPSPPAREERSNGGRGAASGPPTKRQRLMQPMGVRHPLRPIAQSSRRQETARGSQASRMLATHSTNNAFSVPDGTVSTLDFAATQIFGRITPIVEQFNAAASGSNSNHSTAPSSGITDSYNQHLAPSFTNDGEASIIPEVGQTPAPSFHEHSGELPVATDRDQTIMSASKSPSPCYSSSPAPEVKEEPRSDAIEVETDDELEYMDFPPTEEQMAQDEAAVHETARRTAENNGEMNEESIDNTGDAAEPTPEVQRVIEEPVAEPIEVNHGAPAALVTPPASPQTTEPNSSAPNTPTASLSGPPTAPASPCEADRGIILRDETGSVHDCEQHERALQQALRQYQEEFQRNRASQSLHNQASTESAEPLSSDDEGAPKEKSEKAKGKRPERYSTESASSQSSDDEGVPKKMSEKAKGKRPQRSSSESASSQSSDDEGAPKEMSEKAKGKRPERYVSPPVVAGPSAIVRPSAIAGPSYAVAGPSSAVAGPSSAAAGPSSAAAGPSSAVAGPSSAAGGPSSATTISASTVSRPSPVFVGPSSIEVGSLEHAREEALELLHFLQTDRGHIDLPKEPAEISSARAAKAKRQRRRVMQDVNYVLDRASPAPERPRACTWNESVRYIELTGQVWDGPPPPERDIITLKRRARKILGAVREEYRREIKWGAEDRRLHPENYENVGGRLQRTDTLEEEDFEQEDEEQRAEQEALELQRSYAEYRRALKSWMTIESTRQTGVPPQEPPAPVLPQEPPALAQAGLPRAQSLGRTTTPADSDSNMMQQQQQQMALPPPPLAQAGPSQRRAAPLGRTKTCSGVDFGKMKWEQPRTASPPPPSPPPQGSPDQPAALPLGRTDTLEESDLDMSDQQQSSRAPTPVQEFPDWPRAPPFSPTETYGEEFNVTDERKQREHAQEAGPSRLGPADPRRSPPPRGHPYPMPQDRPHSQASAQRNLIAPVPNRTVFGVLHPSSIPTPNSVGPIRSRPRFSGSPPTNATKSTPTASPSTALLASPVIRERTDSRERARARTSGDPLSAASSLGRESFSPPRFELPHLPVVEDSVALMQNRTELRRPRDPSPAPSSQMPTAVPSSSRLSASSSSRLPSPGPSSRPTKRRRETEYTGRSEESRKRSRHHQVHPDTDAYRDKDPWFSYRFDPLIEDDERRIGFVEVDGVISRYEVTADGLMGIIHEDDEAMEVDSAAGDEMEVDGDRLMDENDGARIPDAVAASGPIDTNIGETSRSTNVSSSSEIEMVDLTGDDSDDEADLEEEMAEVEEMIEEMIKIERRDSGTALSGIRMQHVTQEDDEDTLNDNDDNDDNNDDDGQGQHQQEGSATAPSNPPPPTSSHLRVQDTQAALSLDGGNRSTTPTRAQPQDSQPNPIRRFDSYGPTVVPSISVTGALASSLARVTDTRTSLSAGPQSEDRAGPSTSSGGQHEPVQASVPIPLAGPSSSSSSSSSTVNPVVNVNAPRPSSPIVPAPAPESEPDSELFAPARSSSIPARWNAQWTTIAPALMRHTHPRIIDQAGAVAHDFYPYAGLGNDDEGRFEPLRASARVRAVEQFLEPLQEIRARRADRIRTAHMARMQPYYEARLREKEKREKEMRHD